MRTALSQSKERAGTPVIRPATRRRKTGEGRILLGEMDWAGYEMLGAAAEHWGGVRVSYLDGVVELMFPSFEHESRSCLLGWLMDSWLAEKGVRFYPHGSTTLKAEMKRAGKEPDKSYCFHRQAKTPDMVIEVAITSGGLKTLEIYRRWKIPEVWIWQRERLNVFVLEDEEYVKRPASRWFPDLDLRLLAECAKIEEGLEARKKFLRGVK